MQNPMLKEQGPHLGIVVHAFNLSAWDVEAGRS